MTHSTIHPIKHPACVLAAALLLAACSSDNDHDDGKQQGGPQLAVTELAAGSYAVSAGDPASPTAGKYYAAADGARLLVLNDGEQQARVLYQRAAGGRWQATPAQAGANLELIGSNPLPAETLERGALAGNYSVRLAGGAVAAFTVDANGAIAAGASACKLSGSLTASSLPGALALTLNASGCGNLPAQSTGVALRDADYAPAAFRLLAGAGETALLDLWAYRD